MDKALDNMTPSLLPVSVIIPTRNRLTILNRTIGSLVDQSYWPAEVIIVDGSAEDHLQEINRPEFSAKKITLIYQKANVLGAASQRLQGIALAQHNVIWFLDDDVLLDPECTRRLWVGLTWQENVGAVNAMISNQRYTKPGRVTRFMYLLMHGKKLGTYAGKVIGPAWNLLPEDEAGLPDYVRCEWLNTTCTMYKRKALPNPVFSDFFRGYSMFEDLTLSVSIAKHYTLLNARTARIVHESQSGTHKDNMAEISRMALVNRYYVMTRILQRCGWKYNLKLFLLETFGITTSLRTRQNWLQLPKVLHGKILGLKQINNMKSNYGV